MTKTETVTLPRTEYDALITRKEELEDRLAAVDADDGSRIPHEVALAIMRGESPFVAFRNHLGVTLRDLAVRTGIAASYLSRDRARHQTRLYCVAVPDRRRVWHDARCLGEVELRSQYRKCTLDSRRGSGLELPARVVDASG